MTQTKPITDKKNNLLIHNNFYEAIMNLSNENAGLLFKKIFHYHLTQEEIKSNEFVDFTFLSMKNLIDKNDIEYTNKCLKNKENIIKRWNTKTYGRIQTNTKDTNIIEYNIIEDNRKENIKEYNIIEIAEEIYLSYALKKGKAEGIKKLISYLQKSKNMEDDVLKIKNHILQYNNECKEKNYKFMKHFSSYINQQPWNDDIPVEKSKTTVDISYLAKRIKDGFGIFINQNGARVEKSNIVYDGITDYKLDENQLKQLNDILGGSNE